MDPVIRTYIINTKQFETEAAFRAALDYISPYRRQKVVLLKNVKDKRRSLGAAIALNAALEEYGVEERIMEYDLGEQGKPYFRYNPEIHFSISHSGDYAICSIGDSEVGNDIEHARKGNRRIAERFFAKEELDWIYCAQSSDDIEDRILRIWTLKESFLKVTGRGMSLPLKDFAIIVETGQIRQTVNDKTYHIKEYAMPEIFKESENYKISVCSEEMDFDMQLKVVG